METIYRKVYTKDRLPEKEGYYYVKPKTDYDISIGATWLKHKLIGR